MKVAIEIDGITTTIHALEKVHRGAVDFRELGTWNWVQSEYYKALKEILDSEGSAGKSGRYKELTPEYARRKLKQYGEKPILQASGGMYVSLTQEGGNAVVEKKAQEMTLGSKDPKSRWHHTGSGNNPRRAIMDFTNEHEKQIFAPVVKKMRQLVDNAKLRDIRGF